MGPLVPVRGLLWARARALREASSFRVPRNPSRRASILLVSDFLPRPASSSRTFNTSPSGHDRAQKPIIAAEALLSLLKDAQRDAERPAVGRASSRRRKRSRQPKSEVPGRGSGEGMSLSVMEAFAATSGTSEDAELARTADTAEAPARGETDPAQGGNAPVPIFSDAAHDGSGAERPPTPSPASASPDEQRCLLPPATSNPRRCRGATPR
ncbi:hypothetical protein DFJ74DRAFT_697701 [Hyaloraphidium curvatum]|nr:hypothetical protein DFJ74DRAFT_697701 [Hyaloraphidium curvatum]